MLHWLRCCVAGCAAGALAVLPAAHASGRRAVSNAYAPGRHAVSDAPTAWAMPGHDAQRTSQGAGMGPQRITKPTLVLAGLTSEPPIIGRDGALYGFLDRGTPRARLAVVSPAGRVRWTAGAALPAWWNAEGPDPYPVLAPAGAVTFGGGACPQPAFVVIDLAQHEGSDGCLTTVGPDGQAPRHVATRGLVKAGPTLLVEADGTVVRATLGPSSGFVSRADDARRNLTLFAPDGSTRRWGAGCSWDNTAAGMDGWLYAIAHSHPGGPCPGYTVDHSRYGQAGQPQSVVTFTPGGARAWMTPLPAECSGLALSVAPGYVYVGATCATTSAGGHMHARVYALDTQGRLLWTAQGAPDGWPALALDRTSGDLWVADRASVRRLSLLGVRRWQATWRPSLANARETLVLDARGTAYVCGADGLLRVISPAGHLLWQYQFSPPRYGFGADAPSAALGPDGKLYVSSAGAAGVVVFAP